jgi:D-alanyl-D-alanine carboxypeptidase
MAIQKYLQRINQIHRELGIPENYEIGYSLSLHQEETDLIDIENDIYGRLQKLAPPAAIAWHAMRSQAVTDGIVLNIVSAFRSVDKQKEILQTKIMTGQPIAEILQVCAAPGYSEHHTGRALDLTTNDCEPLSESFEKTEAFDWLIENANFYSFNLSYPKDNKAGIAYEPWHWAYK